MITSLLGAEVLETLHTAEPTTLERDLRWSQAVIGANREVELGNSEPLRTGR
jgi:hypothetical protein